MKKFPNKKALKELNSMVNLSLNRPLSKEFIYDIANSYTVKKHMRKFIYCDEIDWWKCCSSCHSDWELEYGEAMEMDIGKNYTLLHCCPDTFNNDLDSIDFHINVLKSVRRHRQNAK